MCYKQLVRSITAAASSMARTAGTQQTALASYHRNIPDTECLCALMLLHCCCCCCCCCCFCAAATSIYL